MMTEMERIESELYDEGAIVDYDVLAPDGPDGLYLEKKGKPSVVLVKRTLPTRKKLCVLAEEAGHHYKSCGPALNLKDTTQIKNEMAGRRWAYERLVPLDRLVDAWDAGCRSSCTMASFFDVTESFFSAALDYYHSKFGVQKSYTGHVIQFDPYFTIYHTRAYR